ncbi:MAG: prepilin-type N-terminal cleavage/methylation domain-containing protein [Nitrospirae bacterium]|nr:prepilin-type N-terminal cleavage/methylation domain-containing protein [Nitrospirota bacterium]
MSIFTIKSSINNPPIPPLVKGGKGGFERGGSVGISGFTLLEVLVAIAVLGIAVTIILQLFSANLRAITASGDYVTASIRAETKMREILDKEISESVYSETTYDGYRMDVSITEVFTDRTENLPVRLFEVYLTVHWTEGLKEKLMTLRTLKMVEKEI